MLEVRQNNFYLNGEKFRIFSGAIHYFRMPPERWRDSIQKARLMGLNTIETYIAWNVHEPQPGEYDFCGMHDICGFLEEIKNAGMYAIVRPGPFICAEWNFGGFPYWLLNKRDIRFRCMEKSYIEEVSKWFDKLIPMLVPYQIDNGGNLIAVQVENEYGSYGNDRVYLNWLKDKMVSCGLDKTFFFTSDGYEDFQLQGGTLPDVLKTVNFGSKATQAETGLRKYQPNGPFVCGEFWNGWFDAWGGAHKGNERSYEQCAKDLEELLDTGGSVNLYMFQGGTNFGFSAGANFSEESGFSPDITSYDYCAPLNECGDITGKYLAIRECLKKYTDVPDEELPPPSKKKSYVGAQLTGSRRLFDSLEQISNQIYSAAPHPMEYYNQGEGYILYRTYINGPLQKQDLILYEVRDRALIFADGELIGVTDRNTNVKIPLEVIRDGIQLDVLVENLARINFGPWLNERKGITEGICFGQQFLFQYEVYPLPMNNIENVEFDSLQIYSEPAFYRFELQVDECCDTYLDMCGWKKGFVVINGVNIGRYWEIGPQHKLFVPKEFLKQGKNEVVIFDEECGRTELKFSDKPDFTGGADRQK